MWKLVDLGEKIEADMGTGFLPYRVDHLEPGRIGLVRVVAQLEHGHKAPSYPAVRDGQEVKLRKGDQERRGEVRDVREGLIQIGPASMEINANGADCPGCGASWLSNGWTALASRMNL